jgi:hypothetical protein
MRRLVAILVLSVALPAYGRTVSCADGTTSKSGRGACSRHGGVAQAKESATVRCQDGSTSKAGPGACSHHGGVAGTETPTARLPDSPRATVPTSAGAPNGPRGDEAASRPTGATAKCKDGTYSHAAERQGACSNHGGVAEWTK